MSKTTFAYIKDGAHLHPEVGGFSSIKLLGVWVTPGDDIIL